MTDEMRKTLARLPYAEKLRRVAELIELSRRFKEAKASVGSRASDTLGEDGRERGVPREGKC